MFFDAPFEIFDLTFVYAERAWRGTVPSACPLWLTPFFSQPSVLPSAQLLSFDNHLDCPRVKFAFLTSPVVSRRVRNSSALRILSLFSGLHTLCTNRRAKFHPNLFLFFRLRTLAKTIGVYPFAHCFPLAFSPSPRRYTIKATTSSEALA